MSYLTGELRAAFANSYNSFPFLKISPSQGHTKIFYSEPFNSNSNFSVQFAAKKLKPVSTTIAASSFNKGAAITVIIITIEIGITMKLAMELLMV